MQMNKSKSLPYHAMLCSFYFDIVPSHVCASCTYNPVESNPIQSNPIIYMTARVSGPPLAAAHLTHAAVFVTLVPVVDLAPDTLAVAPIILARFDE
jgi:hypothetical protein